jgi:cytoskeleton protein RodZ
MSETNGGVAAGTTAGSLLRQARQAQGVHIAVLAASIKVTQRKLEALEADRLDELPDATFTRALAQTVCRTLKIDAAPVLALLPPPPGHRLEHVSEGINAPFRERSGREPARDWSVLSSPAMWAPLLLVVAAAVVYFLPSGWLASLRSPSTPAASAPALVTSSVPTTSPAPVATASAPATAMPSPPAASVVVETVHSIPATPAEAASAAATEPAPQGVLHVRTVAGSWIEVLDGRGQMLISRVVQPGEAVGLDGAMPLKVIVGNAGATQLSFRGRKVELAGYTRDNVARLDLK